MTIIFEMGGEFWIESLPIPATAVAANTTVSADLALTRAGNFLCGQVTIGNVVNTSEIVGRLTNAGANIAFGEFLDTVSGTIRVRLKNSSGTNETAAQGYVIIYMRKRG